MFLSKMRRIKKNVHSSFLVYLVLKVYQSHAGKRGIPKGVQTRKIKMNLYVCLVLKLSYEKNNLKTPAKQWER